MKAENLFKAKGLNVHLWEHKGYRCRNKAKDFAVLYKAKDEHSGSLLVVPTGISDLQLNELLENEISSHTDRRQVKSTVAQGLLVDWLNGFTSSLETYRNEYPKEVAFYESTLKK
jgi:hypothetical protein